MATKTSVFVLAISCLGLLAGCEQGENWMRPQACLCRDLPGMVKSQVFQAALTEMSQRCRIRQSNPADGAIVCEPEYLAENAPSSMQPFRIVSSPSQLRRVTRVSVCEQPYGARLSVCVSLERRDTARVQLYRAMRPEADVPAETPVSTQGLGPEHSEVWTVAGRDHELESSLMASILRHFPASTTQPEPRPQ